MTKIIYTEALDQWTEARPVAITVHDEYWDFAECHLDYLRAEKPELMNALLLCDEMGAYLNLLGKLNAELKKLYSEKYRTEYSQLSFMDENDLMQLAGEEAQEEAGCSFFYEDDQVTIDER